MNDTKNAEDNAKKIITIESVSDADLETVDGGRDYGWGGGGWNGTSISNADTLFGYDDSGWSSGYDW